MSKRGICKHGDEDHLAAVQEELRKLTNVHIQERVFLAKAAKELAWGSDSETREKLSDAIHKHIAAAPM